MMKQYLKTIKENVMFNIDEQNNSDLGSQSNDYYLPEFGNRFLELCEEFPCWTAVMNDYFHYPRDVATSARSEAYFGELKTSLENTIRRVDKVLVIHCRQIDADLKLGQAAINKLNGQATSKGKEKDSDDDSDCSYEYLKQVEKWKKKEVCIDWEDDVNEREELFEMITL